MQSNRLMRLAVNEEGFVFDPQTGESFTVNGTGRVLLMALIAQQSEEGIVGELVHRFGLKIQEAQADLRDFVEHLRFLRLL
ncbi:MAG: PqqD family protein [Magnetococcales bacterium]|nr:PqqD family protein [Magnetococcales bacterium]